MCMIVEQLLGAGAPWWPEKIIERGGALRNNGIPIKIRCIHPGGRSETYFLQSGQSLIADEEARFEVLETYPPQPPEKEKEERKICVK